LKPENLLLSENNILKIIDFGLSNSYKNNPLLKTPCGSPCYAAPEMLLGKQYSGQKIDIWSTGIILYAMVNGFLPFEVISNLQQG
jgi:5'-AMP-activated protein kinase catalytic alpha subunit